MLEDGRAVTAERFGSAFQAAAKAAGLGPDPNLVPHSLRHGYGSHLIRAGVDIVTVSKRMGHASVDITLRVYAHEVDDLRAAAEEQVVDAMDALEMPTAVTA
jgi:integrase